LLLLLLLLNQWGVSCRQFIAAARLSLLLASSFNLHPPRFAFCNATLAVRLTDVILLCHPIGQCISGLATTPAPCSHSVTIAAAEPLCARDCSQDVEGSGNPKCVYHVAASPMSQWQVCFPTNQAAPVTSAMPDKDGCVKA
jgi:hypothetical protein